MTIGFVNRSLTGWDLIGLDVNTLSTNAHGFLSLLCLLCLFAPLAVPFMKQWWGAMAICGTTGIPRFLL